MRVQLAYRRLIAALLFLLLTSEDGALAEDRAIYALLVGINDYSDVKSDYAASDLKGTANDVSLMKELLIGTFGMPDDSDHLRILSDNEATHSAIAQAFSSHLIDKAKLHPEATFLFYFSGHGSLAADDNGDEGDQYDETLVAYDSRDPGKSDIRDDEIEHWLAALKRYTGTTGNIVLIFDSCHSGTVSKNPTLVSRRAPIDMRLADSGQQQADDFRGKDVSPISNPGRVYSIITGSMADEVSNEDLIETENGQQKYHGLLTYYLVQTLKRSPLLTYREAVVEAARFVQKRAPSQHPQAEGDFDRVVLGGIGTRQMPFIAVTSAPKHATDPFSIAVGEAQGIQKGALLAIYSARATKLAGEEGKIADAVVIKAGLASSTAKLTRPPKESVSIASKVRVVAPFSVENRLTVGIAKLPQELGMGTHVPIRSELEARLRDNALLASEQDTNTASLSVAVGCMKGQDIIAIERHTDLSPDCNKVYYIRPREQVGTLFGFSIPFANASTTVDLIISALEKAARQENLRSLMNAASPLSKALAVSLVRVEVNEENGNLTIEREISIAPSGAEPMGLGEFFRFRVANNGTDPFYYSIIGLGTSGSVFVLGDAAAGEKLLPGAVVSTKPALKAGPPVGLESYVVLATTSPVNIRFLEAPGTRTRDTSPLGWLLDGLANPGFRDPEAIPHLDLNSWATTRLDIKIQPQDN